MPKIMGRMMDRWGGQDSRRTQALHNPGPGGQAGSDFQALQDSTRYIALVENICSYSDIDML
jgi:hypothetical protein